MGERREKGFGRNIWKRLGKRRAVEGREESQGQKGRRGFLSPKERNRSGDQRERKGFYVITGKGFFSPNFIYRSIPNALGI